MTNTLSAIKTIRSHVGYARFLATCIDAGWIAKVEGIPSPFSYSRHWPLLQQQDGKLVFVRETSHKIYQVFEIPKDAEIFHEDPDS